MQPDPPLACWFGDPQFEAMVAAVSVRPPDKAPRTDDLRQQLSHAEAVIVELRGVVADLRRQIDTQGPTSTAW